MNLSYKVITGHEIKEYVEHIIDFRLKYFKDFPYLYCGTHEAEVKAIKDYDYPDDAILILVFSEKRLVGISAGYPLSSPFRAIKVIQDAVIDSGRKLKEYYYLADVIIAQQFRGQKIFSKILKIYEDLVKGWGYKKNCFISVIRSKDHPMRPKSYTDLDVIFQKKGYQKTDIVVEFSWPTLQSDDSVINQPNILAFWEKEI